MQPTWEFFDGRKPGWLKFSQKMTDILDDRYGKGVAEVRCDQSHRPRGSEDWSFGGSEDTVP